MIAMKTIGIVLLTFLCCSVVFSDDDTFAFVRLEFQGQATGGTVTFGVVGNSEERVVQANTIAGDGPAQITAKLLASFNASHVSSDGSFGFVRAAPDGVALEIGTYAEGDVFFRSTDAGIETVKPVTGLTAIAHKNTQTVTLNWTAVVPTPDMIFVQRNHHRIAALSGGTTTFEDTLFGGDDPVGGLSVEYRLVCGQARTGDTRLVRFSDVSFVETDNPESLPDDIFDFTFDNLPDGVVGRDYDGSLNKKGGTSPIAWSLANGTLPPGLTLASSGFEGQIGGVPTVAGTFNFTVLATDAHGLVATKSVSIKITSLPVLDKVINR